MTQHPVHITIGPDDVDGLELLGLVLGAYAYMNTRIDPPSSILRMSAADFKAKADTETLVVARIEGALVGCLFCRPAGDWLYVSKMAVTPGSQRIGIGRALMDSAFALARAGEHFGVELETRVELTENHAAFGRLGFRTVDETSHEGFDRPTSITMRARV